MQKYILLFAFTLLMSVNLFGKDGGKFGKEITLTEKTKISEILSNTKEFEGKKVLVEGTILNVCAKRGCWIEIASDKEFESIRVKVNDGIIVFPMEVKGKTALVEGEFHSFTVETGDGCSNKDCGDHDKEGKDSKDDCEDHKKEIEKENKTFYQIKGFGAVI